MSEEIYSKVSKIEIGNHKSLCLPDSKGDYHHIKLEDDDGLSEVLERFHKWDDTRGDDLDGY